MYGYYGRTSGRPDHPAASRGSYSAIGHPDNSGQGLASPYEGSGSVGGLPSAVEDDDEAGAADDETGEDEAFVPDFRVPEGVAVPPTPRQHVMMVGTARTTVRSPQVRSREVLTRLFIPRVCFGYRFPQHAPCLMPQPPCPLPRFCALVSCVLKARGTAAAEAGVKRCFFLLIGW